MKKLKKRRRKLHTRKVFLLNSILVVFLFLGIGYSLLSTELTIDGSTKVTEYLEPTLYNVLFKETKKNGLAKEYIGNHQDSMDASLSTEKIYHWYAKNSTEGTAILDKNNVIFAGHCWQMIRTTDTGGVKMIYNGEPENDQCLNTRGTHVGYASKSSQNLASNYWYGTDYTYDSTNQVFSVSGTTEQATWSEANAPGLIGKYTCKQTTESATCSTLYYIESYNDTSSANTLILNSNSNYSQFGSLLFNANSNSLAYIGYMYGDVYPYNSFSVKYSQNLSASQPVFSSLSLNTSSWYADSISYNSTTGKYSLVNPYQVSSSSDYPNLVGKYTFRSSNQTNTATSVYYIAGVSGSNMYYKQLQDGYLLSAYEPIIFGDSYTDNGNGTYTINNPISVSLTNWFTNSADYKNKYTCNNSSTTCASPRYITETGWFSYGYLDSGEKIMVSKTRNGTTLTDTLLVKKDEFVINSSNYSDYKYTCNTDNATCTEATLRMIDSFTTKGYNYTPNRYFGSSVTWDGTNYTLVNPIEIENYNNLDNLATHHYMCESYGLKTCQTVAYIYYTSLGMRYYITLSNGVPSVNKALEDMLAKNTTNSMIKSGVDAWYKHYLLEDYDEYIEDTIFCNDRSSISYDGWNPDGGNITDFLSFNGFMDLYSDLSCINITDRFSIFNNSAKLTYKVGLMTNSEMILLNNKNAQITGLSYWLASPSTLNYNLPQILYVSGTDGLNYFGSNTVSNYGVRPAISLIPGIEYSAGDGSMANPYIVDV